MRLYKQVFHTGVMPGPFVFMRDRLIHSPVRSIRDDAKEGLQSSSIHARINARAGLSIDRQAIGAHGIVAGKHGSRSFFWRAYGVDHHLHWKV